MVRHVHVLVHRLCECVWAMTAVYQQPQQTTTTSTATAAMPAAHESKRGKNGPKCVLCSYVCATNSSKHDALVKHKACCYTRKKIPFIENASLEHAHNRQLELFGSARIRGGSADGPYRFEIFCATQHQSRGERIDQRNETKTKQQQKTEYG